MTTRRAGPIVGILGGMGPAATADFYAKLVRCTPADADQEHLRVVIWADPTVPDRSTALVGDGPDPTPALVHGARVLLAAGADLLAVPCNTAHAFLAEVERQTGAKIVHMVAETAAHVAQALPRPATVGLLATTGTVRAGLYQDWLGRVGVDVVTPDDDDQDAMMSAIRAAKSGRIDLAVRERVRRVAEDLAGKGAGAVVAGCTEIPLVLDDDAAPVPVIDTALVLARAVVEAGRSRCHACT